MFTLINNWLNQRIIKRSTITPLQWDEAYASLPLLAGLTPDEHRRLKDLVILFLHHKVFEGVQGLAVTQSMALIIALQACLLVLNIGLGGYAGWKEIIIYPSGFAPKRVMTDEYGVVHNVRSELAGESWQHGPVVLSWGETARAGIIDGHNLVIHEFSHKLDMQNGSANGFPPLHADMNQALWVESFSLGFEDIQYKCAQGRNVGIDCYAATSPAEFFAVLSEVFFERPGILQQHYSVIYNQLRQYYRQDPLLRMS
jgi:hypothetical protein